MPAVLGSPPTDTPTTRCRYYRERCGLPAAINPGLGSIVLRAGTDVSAVTMPTELGVRVRNHIRGRGRYTGPVISHPRAKRWTFLVNPDIPDDVSIFAEMFRINVTIARYNAQIALPAPTTDFQFRLWVHPPEGSFRLPGTQVVDAIREVTRRYR
ncbi:DNA-directed RNA polymerase subunit beta [Nocardia cyriacigeorgica]|uniref:DNA-directed RNA polymerase subunit beta n=1 Tax=Nocardia cyriacigeorgica TaxID=135487 RepID=UPI0018954E15|nr:DNA-directed RNA polymerase subunit beta [Nocardia cyriacigeorgica]MBF6326503.1 DNA-directed RNA polymerase subunit beta [Nocardia cyriacigeorgica]